jgi:DUF4097 and DUF4098 domain-containing protein YvlB
MKSLMVWGSAALALAMMSPSLEAGHRRSSSTTIHEEGGVRSCSDSTVRFDDRDSLTAETETTIAVSDVSTLELSSSHNGGISVVGSDGKDFLVTLCKAVPDDGRGEAKLREIALSRSGNKLGVNGPDGEEWAAHLIVRAPRGAAISLTAENGPVGLVGFEGSATIESQNGPVSLRGCRGKISVDSQNGPISVSESSGNLNLEARNGPLSVRLGEGGWRDGALDGRTENGPLSLELASGANSGVRVESAGRSPFRCRADACKDARRNWDDDHKRIDFGSGEPLVRLSTVNGPVSIDSRD